jgi:hypothetical protein
MNTDPRLALIHDWLQTTLTNQQYSIAPASSDASFRRYFRVKTAQQNYIVMDAPREHEDIGPFIQVDELLAQNNVNVPTIFARSDEHGFLLLTDFGNQSLLASIKENTADLVYSSAIDQLLKIQQIDPSQAALPIYDHNLLHREMELFPTWFISKHLNLTEPDFLNDIYSLLIENALNQPSVVVHRDFHSRNLMYINNENPLGVIDFQDAVIGPVSYDLVSLLRDCYIEWPENKIDQWLQHYLTQSQQQQRLEQVEFTQLKRWFDLMGLQRHIKVLGIFCRLYYRDGKANYLNDLPLTLRYVLNIAKRYPEFTELVNYLHHPKIQAIL